MCIRDRYNDWQKKLGGKGESSNEDARFVLPNAAGTKMLVTMNARELTHFFSLRCCNRAQWEDVYKRQRERRSWALRMRLSAASAWTIKSRL